MSHSGTVISLAAGADLSSAAVGSALTVSNADGRVELTNSPTDEIVGFLVTPANSSAVGSHVDVLVSGYIDVPAQANVTRGYLILGTATPGQVASVDYPGTLAQRSPSRGATALSSGVAGGTVRVLI